MTGVRIPTRCLEAPARVLALNVGATCPKMLTDPDRWDTLMIPELVDNVLPEGVYECSFEEVDAAFGRFWRSDRRIDLTAKLKRFLEDARKSGIVGAIVIDGSYVTGKAEPNDIDLIVAYRPDFELGQELRPFEYNVLSKNAIKLRLSLRRIHSCGR